jgi:hypothetical protein
LSGVDPRRLVFVDECSTNVRLAPLKARAPRGERAFDKAQKTGTRTSRWLERGQIVMMDNLQIHKMKKVRGLIEGHGCRLVFLSSYSRDFNSMEEAFSKFKALLRKPKARSFEALVETTGTALLAVSEEDARDFFTHRGYGKPQALSV